jgi:hypothetical protein
MLCVSVGATIILIASVLALVALLTTGVDAGLVGLVLSYALNTTGSLVRDCSLLVAGEGLASHQATT